MKLTSIGQSTFIGSTKTFVQEGKHGIATKIIPIYKGRQNGVKIYDEVEVARNIISVGIRTSNKHDEKPIEHRGDRQKKKGTFEPNWARYQRSARLERLRRQAQFMQA